MIRTDISDFEEGSNMERIISSSTSAQPPTNPGIMFIYKIDSRTELRLLTLDHLQPFFELAHQNREHIREWMFWIREDYSSSDAEKHIQTALDRCAANNGFEAGIWFEDQLAGCVRYNYIDWTHQNTELGYWLGAAFQGHGLATKACRALVEHSFNELGLNRVEIRCMSENLRSRRVPQRLGFIQEGVVRQVRWRLDHFDDHIVYGLLASEWTGK
jgi:ribosomal-protein-serine acetyltransferase